MMLPGNNDGSSVGSVSKVVPPPTLIHTRIIEKGIVHLGASQTGKNYVCTYILRAIKREISKF